MKPRTLFILEVLLALAAVVALTLLASGHPELGSRILSGWPPLR